ncbi:sensor histidine kinase NtrY-like [Arenibaculum pallidiluteum]|uniref:sensor histidine kinase NtrY-like n=1 Tax=Arenibaculum pallidiluteum TaxID=2812559 RepID=UPI001A97A036|nr:PAS domain-containing sensor histidine kinase [Arenibaculum pallidiluteum]
MSITQPADQPPGLWRQVMAWAGRVGLANKLAVALTVAAIAAGIVTYGAMTASAPFGADVQTVSMLLTLDLVLLLALGAIVARRVVALWTERRRGLAGSRLHVRLVAIFSLLAVLPAIVTAAFATVIFHEGIQGWFSDRVRTAVNESLAVAQAYLHEHQQAIRAEALAMANDLNRDAIRLIGEPQRFAQVVTTQAALRGLTEAIVFDGTGRTLVRSGLSFAIEFEPIPESAMDQARRGEVVLMTADEDDRIRALVRLDSYVDTFLFIGRLVDQTVLSHLEKANQAASVYRELEGHSSNLQLTFTLVFATVALLLLLAAIWTGLHFATTLVAPISALIGAAERVRAGDLAVRVSEIEPEDEVGSLARAFNRMTSQLESQRRELVEANRQLDLRRRFTEAVLSGVSAGVLGLDEEGRVTLPNGSAAKLLGVGEAEALVGRRISDIAPELGDLVGQARRRPTRLSEGQVQIRRAGAIRTLLVRVAAEATAGDVRGFVVTFDDVSELLSAQRKAAWADVARRIAHEIKNPLTPIQLSAERLRRKYLKEITSDPETFQTCTDTIVRQVGDIGRMVDEFSAFARMPSPVMSPQNLNELARQAVFLQSSAHPEVRYECELPKGPLTVPCDGRQISQALINLLQNAYDAIEGRPPPPDGAEPPQGWIRVSIAERGDEVEIAVEDNGRGLPVEERDRLTEPYVTTRTKGTGLGLAIVKKIMEDHGGVLALADRPEGGARVNLVIPRTRPAEPAEHAGDVADAVEQRQIRYGA